MGCVRRTAVATSRIISAPGFAPTGRPPLGVGRQSLGRLRRLPLGGVRYDQLLESPLVEMAPGGPHRDCLGLADRVGAILEQMADNPRARGFELRRRHNL